MGPVHDGRVRAYTGNRPPQLRYLGQLTCPYCGEAMKVPNEPCPQELIDNAARELEKT